MGKHKFDLKRMNKEITYKKDKKGFTRFFYGGKDITNLWMGFFSDLPAEKEYKCLELYLKKYRKMSDSKLNP